MNKRLEYGIHETLSVKNETLKGFLLNLAVFKKGAAPEDPNVLCDIANFNNIAIDVIIKREQGGEIVHFEGYLEDYLVALYGQTTRFEQCHKKTGVGYLVNIDFTPYALALNGKDELIVKIKANLDAFVDADPTLTNALSFETVRTVSATSKIPVVKYQHIGVQNDDIDMEIGDAVIKVVVLTDLTSDYIGSEKAKIVSGVLSADGDYESVFTERLLYAQNMAYLDMNPDSDIQDLVVLWNKVPLNNVKLRAKLSMLADKDAKVLSIHERYAY